MRVAFFLLTVALGGCAAPDRPAAADPRHSLTCRDQAQCNLYWQRARQWVMQNSPNGIHAETNWVIVTDYPKDLGFGAGYTVTKTATDGGGAVLTMSVACSTFVPCVPPREAIIERFKLFVAAP